MFVIYYKNQKLDKYRTVKSYVRYIIRNKVAPRLLIRGEAVENPS